jgi:hypothetical protein
MRFGFPKTPSKGSAFRSKNFLKEILLTGISDWISLRSPVIHGPRPRGGRIVALSAPTFGARGIVFFLKRKKEKE